MIMHEHLDALELALSHERVRLANAGSVAERELRSVWVCQIEKEIAHECVFLDIELKPCSDDELLAKLFA